MLIILLSTHILLTARSSLIQRKVWKGIKLSLGREHGFSILATTLAATLGTGNIIGVSTAIALGGPGALLWCFVTGFFGMATTYYECYLASAYKTEHGGGPMYILKNVLNKKCLGFIYALFLLLVCLGTGCLTQSNAVADSFRKTLGIHPVVTGLTVSLIAGFVIVGGKKSIMKVCEKVVPVMCIVFIVCCIYLLILNARYIPQSLYLVFSGAFTPGSVAGGIAGGSFICAARYGIARGLFTNEAGLGSAGVFAGTSTLPPKEQGLISMTATFWDTIVICTITGLVIISSYLADPSSIEGYSVGGYLNAAFSSIPYAGNLLLCLSIAGFAVSTIIGWFFIGEQAATFIFGAQKDRALPYIKALYVFMVFSGCNFSLEKIWEVADTFNLLLIIPNVYVLIRLSSKHRQT